MPSRSPPNQPRTVRGVPLHSILDPRIGFTMSIFTTALAFEAEAARDIAKIAILFSMVISVMVSWLNFIISERSIAKVAKALQPAEAAGSDIAIG